MHTIESIMQRTRRLETLLLSFLFLHLNSSLGEGRALPLKTQFGLKRRFISKVNLKCPVEKEVNGLTKIKAGDKNSEVREKQILGNSTEGGLTGGSN